MNVKRVLALTIITILLVVFLIQLSGGQTMGFQDVSGYGSNTSLVIGGHSKILTTPASVYPVSFTESGLPKGTTWSLVLDGQKYTSSSNSISDIPVQSGSHTYNVTTILFGQEIKYVPSNSSGTMNVPQEIYMKFNFTSYYLISFVTSPNDTGSLSPPAGSQTWYVAGSSINITATPHTGYNFSNWFASPALVFKNASLPSTIVALDGPGTITAFFDEQNITNTSTTTQTTTSSSNSTTSAGSSTTVSLSTTTTTTNSNTTITNSSTTSSTSTSTTSSDIITDTTATSSSNSSSSSSSTSSQTSVTKQSEEYFYLPFISKGPPTLEGASVFSLELCAVIGAIFAIFQTRKKKTSSEGSSARGWRW